MNKIFLSGRLTKDPELRKTQSGIDVCNFTIAVEKPGTRKDDQLPPDYFDCTKWGDKEGPGRAGVIAKHFHKGDGIVLYGPMLSNKYTDKQGNNRTGWYVKVDDFEFPMARRTSPESAPAAQTAPSVPAGAVEVSQEELPF